MLDVEVASWPRSLFQATSQNTKIFFACFGNAPLAPLPISLVRFGLPDAALVEQVEIREHPRSVARKWFEAWWGGAFGVYAEQDLGTDLALLTSSDLCQTLAIDLPDRADLVPLQTVWGLSRWLCARGAHVVLDVHAFRFRTREQVEQFSFDAVDVTREVKLVLESEPNAAGLHLLHTRGLCKFARPELLCLIAPGDAALMGGVLNQLSRALIEGAPAHQLKLRLAEGIELSAAPARDQALVGALGLERAVDVLRSDGASLGGISLLVER